jgi:hypothetical protein
VLSVCVFNSKSHVTVLELKSFAARPQEKNFEILMVFRPKPRSGWTGISREAGFQTLNPPSSGAPRDVPFAGL